MVRPPSNCPAGFGPRSCAGQLDFSPPSSPQSTVRPSAGCDLACHTSPSPFLITLESIIVLESFSSASAAERLRAAAAFLADIPAATEVLIVGASREAADDLARQATIAREVTFGLHRASFMELAARLAATEMALLGVAPAASLGDEALAARVSFEAMRDRALTYFAPVAQFPGFARALAATLAELRLGGVDPGALDGGWTGAGRRRAGPALRASARGSEGRRSRGPAGPRGTRRRPARSSRSPDADASARRVDRGRGGGRARARRSLRPRRRCWPRSPPGTTLRWRRSGPSARASAATTRAGVDGDLSRARHFLFAEAAPPSRTAGGEVLFFSAPGEGREAVEIARRILDEARAGTPFDEMAVLLRAPEIYGSLLEVALQRAGIPAWFARGTRGRIRPAARSWRCSIARWSGSRRGDSRSTSRSVRCHRWTRPARRRRIARLGGARGRGLGPAAERDTAPAGTADAGATRRQ